MSRVPLLLTPEDRRRDMGFWLSYIENQAPELAAFGSERVQAGPSYLATTGANGFTRAHEVNWKLQAGHLSSHMFTTSPKGADLRRDPRFVLHRTVDDVHRRG
jgi:hypothetical protein